MSLILNNKKISKVYLGNTPVVKIYKGDTLVYKASTEPDGQLELTFATAVTSGNDLFYYAVGNKWKTYSATQDYAIGDKLIINDLPSDTTIVSNKYDYYSNYVDGYSNISVLKDFDTSKTLNSCANMFNNCSNLTSLDVSSFDTSNVTNMSYMFNNCPNLTSLDVSSFDTSNVTNMNSMFNNCSKLTSLDVSSFDTSNVTTMNYMFNNCPKLTSLDVSSFDTSNVTNMNSMFDYCSNLTSITFGEGWGKNTSSLTLDLSYSTKLDTDTFNSMLTMYDRATNGLSAMTINIYKKNTNIPDGWVTAMTARGYTISLG